MTIEETVLEHLQITEPILHPPASKPMTNLSFDGDGMEFIARVFLETAATMVLLACVNGANVDSFDLDLGFGGFEGVSFKESVPAIPAEYYSDFDSPLVHF